MQPEDWGLDAPLTPEDVAEMGRGMKVIALRKEIVKAALRQFEEAGGTPEG